MPYKSRSIDFEGILDDIIRETNFFEDPARLLSLIKEDVGATAKVMEEIGIDIERVIDDFYIKKVPPPLKEEEISQEVPEEAEPEAEVEEKEAEEMAEEEEIILSHEEIAYLQEKFSRHVLTVAGLPEKEISKIIEALTDKDISIRGIPQDLAECLSPLLSSPVVRAVDKLSKSDVAKIRELLRRTKVMEEEPKEEVKEDVIKEKPEVPPKKAALKLPEIIDYDTFIDIVVDESRLTNEVILETVNYETEIVYEIMTKLLHISPEKISKDLLGMRTKEQIDSYIGNVISQLRKDSYEGFLEIIKPRQYMMYDLMKRLEIGLKEALKSISLVNQADYHIFVDRLFLLYGHMLAPELLQEMVFGDPIIASGIINQCGLEQSELIKIVKNHDGIRLEMEKLFENYNLDYEPFKDIKYRQIEEAVEGLKEEVQERLGENKDKVEFLYGIYDIGLNYESEARKYDFCMIIAKYANRLSANPYEIALRLGDRLKIPLPQNFLRDMALGLAMSLKRAELVSEERFNELLEKANQYRQEEGYYMG